MEEVLRRTKYEKLKQDVKEFNQTHKTVKQGLAFMPIKYGIAYGVAFLNQGYSLVHVFTDGSVSVSHGGVEMGQGLNTKLHQVAAELFQID